MVGILIRNKVNYSLKLMFILTTEYENCHRKSKNCAIVPIKFEIIKHWKQSTTNYKKYL